MVERYSFIPVFSCLLGGLAWWSTQVGTSPTTAIVDTGADSAKASFVLKHQELLESLDRIITYQHYYHGVYGRYTNLLHRIGYEIPPQVAHSYDIRVAEASGERLLVTAFSEVDGKVLDLVSIDQDYGIHANFPLPPPRVDSLKANALKFLHRLSNAPQGQKIDELGVFKGYFKYSLKEDSRDRRVASAIGIKAPVLGMKVEINPESKAEADLDMELAILADMSADDGNGKSLAVRQTGQVSTEELPNLKEEVLLAQKIFFGETGRYARSWSELSKMVHFQFNGRGGTRGESLLEPTPPVPAGTLAQRINRQITSQTDKGSLEIEPISTDDSK